MQRGTLSFRLQSDLRPFLRGRRSKIRMFFDLRRQRSQKEGLKSSYLEDHKSVIFDVLKHHSIL